MPVRLSGPLAVAAYTPPTSCTPERSAPVVPVRVGRRCAFVVRVRQVELSLRGVAVVDHAGRDDEAGGNPVMAGLGEVPRFWCIVELPTFVTPWPASTEYAPAVPSGTLATIAAFAGLEKANVNTLASATVSRAIPLRRRESERRSGNYSSSELDSCRSRGG